MDAAIPSVRRKDNTMTATPIHPYRKEQRWSLRASFLFILLSNSAFYALVVYLGVS